MEIRIGDVIVFWPDLGITLWKMKEYREVIAVNAYWWPQALKDHG